MDRGAYRLLPRSASHSDHCAEGGQNGEKNKEGGDGGVKIADKINRQSLSEYKKSLKYSLHLIVHPFDGFWDLIHEKRGSMAAANTILIAVLLIRIWRVLFTNFMFIIYDPEKFNILMYSLQLLVPLAIGCLANWCLTTLFDGKGTLKNIYMAVCYSLTPYVLIQLPMIFLSNIVTSEEGVFWVYLNQFTTIWIGLLLMCAMMMIHDYSLGKALFAAIATVVGMLIIVFILLLFFSLISDGFAYFISLLLMKGLTEDELLRFPKGR
ncbi:MAG: YIP1 family protein, partial [Lachnospiraceae bacterium]|nr:YIP1 family protein [Lachnospiraceae bacterium]